MPTVETILTVITVVSFLIAVFEFSRNQIRRSREACNVALIKQQLESMHNGLTSVFHSLDAIVQIPKQRTTTVEELQDLARIARGQVYILRSDVKDSRGRLEEWKFGELMASSNLTKVFASPASAQPHAHELEQGVRPN